MRPTLTIFIDGLPFDQLHKMRFTRTLPSQGRLIPILGYSVNCQTQLFTGKTPDEVGFFCEWELSPETSPFRAWHLPFRAISPIERFYPAKRVFHKIVDRLAPVSYTKNIPAAYLPFFDETGHSVFAPSFSQPSLLDQPGLTKFLFHQFLPGQDQDARIVHAALERIRESARPGSILLTLGGIDHCSHWDGVASEPYDRLLEENDHHIAQLTEEYLEKEPEGTVFVVSDHGMANIGRLISVDLERRFGPARLDRYTYFSEATILRIWVDDASLRREIASFVKEIEGIEELSDLDRKDFGITRRQFGDLIFHTHEGVQIVPSFWGPKPSVGMHGHHPRYPAQHGICLASRDAVFDGPMSARDFYRTLSGHFDA